MKTNSAMHFASVENLTKSYGERVLFTGISFHLNRHDRVALIAGNGKGKSSLLDILAGKDHPDDGTVWLHPDCKVVYLEQEQVFELEKSVLDNLLCLDHPTVNIFKEYLNIPPNEMNGILPKMDEYDAWKLEGIYKQILGKLHIPDTNKSVKHLSGGQKKRLALAKALLEAHLNDSNTLFILDEPTNHLDIAMIEWLEKYLLSQKSTLILVSHDRYFLDAVCTDYLELEDHKVYRHPGPYENYLANKAMREEVEQSELSKDKNIYRRELEWMRRQPQARTTKSKSREDSFYEIEKRVKLQKEQNDFTLDVKMNRLGGKVLEMKKVYKRFGEKKILDGFDYTYKRGERLGIVGLNGVGKSTFIRIALGLEEADSGKINHGETVVFGHFSQEGLDITEDKRVINYVKDFGEFFPTTDGKKISAGKFLERFGFSDKQQHTFISKLSGGEKRRLQLLGILYKNPNFLILDEPTNDLDLQTLQLLEAFLEHFQGCLLIVSHDRYFMDKLVQHLIVMEGDGEIRIFPGNYSQYRQAKKQEKQKEISSPSTKPDIKETKIREPRLSYKEKREFEEIEKKLPLLENEKNLLEQKLNLGDLKFEEINNLSIRLGEISREIEEKEIRWIEISERMEQK